MTPEGRAADDALVERVRNAALRRRGLVEQLDDIPETPTTRWLWFLREIPGFAAQWTRVPAAFYEPTDAEVSAVVVRCPCGAEELPEVREAQVEECACGRHYLLLVGRLYAAFGPNAPTS